MKIKNLIAVAALLLGSTSAFAAITVGTTVTDDAGNIQYEVTSVIADPADTYEVKVVKALKEVTALEIPASFTKKDLDNKVSTFRVRSFDAGWEAAGKDIKAKLTDLTLSIDFLGAYTNVFTNLAALEKLTVKIALESAVSLPTLPDNVKKTVKELDYSALPGCKDLPANAFEVSGDNFKLLTKIALPAKLETIGEAAFKSSNITSVEIPATVTTIGNAAFKLSKVATITLPEELKEISTEAFEKSALTAITVPAKVTAIKNYAFNGCEALATADLSGAEKLETIGNNAFAGAKLLAAITIPAAVTSIGSNAFDGCEALATVTIAGEKVGAIGDAAFNGCKALTALDLSKTADTYKVVKAGVFAGCEALKEIKLSKYILGIQDDAFADCVIEDLDLSVCEKLGVLRPIFGTAHDAENPNALKSIKLPAGLTTIYAGVFAYSTSLTEITIPEGVALIEAGTFDHCSALATVTMSDGEVEDNAFYYCTGLKTFNYLNIDPTNDYTDYVADEAFLGCKPFIKFVTTATYQAANPTAPKNCKYGTGENSKMKTVADKGTSGKAFGIFENTTPFDVIVEKSDDVKLYSIYVDEGAAIFQALRTYDGQYVIQPNAHIIIKSDTPKDNIEYTTETASGKASALVDEIQTLAYATRWGWGNLTTDETLPLSDFQSWLVNPGEYVYRLTNNAATGGFGFTFFTGDTMKQGQFFIISEIEPASAGRLQTIWLDEDGNVEGDATAIQKIEASTEDGAIYNLAGQKVNAAYKGVVIKNGKKYMK